MAVPHKLFLLISLSSTWLLIHYAPNTLLLSSAWRTGLAIQTLLICIHVTWTAVIYPKLFSPLRKLPQPSGGSFINGHFWKIFREPSGVPHREWMQTIPNDGLIYYTSFLNAPRVLVTNPEGLREVLSSKSYEFVKPNQVIRAVARILGMGILFAEGDEHRRQRKALMPAFSFRHIKDLYPVFWEKTRELVLALDEDIAKHGLDDEPFHVVEVQKWASRSTLDIIGAAGMGKSFGAIDDENSELYQMYQRVFRPSGMARYMRLLALVLPFGLVASLPNSRNNMVQESSAFLKRLCHTMIQEKRENMAQGKQTGFDILSIAIESGGFSDENLVNQMMTFLAAGHETTATALTWAMYLISKNSDVQKRLRAALEEAQLPSVRDSKTTVTAETLDRIPYLHAVINEVLRFVPPVPSTLREASHDEYILGHLVPAKTHVVMSPIAINVSPQLWGSDAGEFNPDRWMGSGKANTGGAESNYSFMTFLHGPRSCIGQGFSRAEFACLLAGWVQAFEIELEQPEREIEIAGGLTQRPKGGVPVTLTPIH